MASASLRKALIGEMSFAGHRPDVPGMRNIQLTSNPRRVAANRLYQAMGFERYETNCYKLEIAGPGPR